MLVCTDHKSPGYTNSVSPNGTVTGYHAGHGYLVFTPEFEVLQKHLFRAVKCSTQHSPTIYMLVCEIFSQATIIASGNNSCLRPSTLSNLSAIERAKEFILTHFDEPILLQDIARYAWMSPFHLSRLFKKILRHSPHAYLLKVRLKNAQLLLRTTNLPIADVSILSGFSRPDYFATTFIKDYGLTPTKYRDAYTIYPS